MDNKCNRNQTHVVEVVHAEYLAADLTYAWQALNQESNPQPS